MKSNHLIKDESSTNPRRMPRGGDRVVGRVAALVVLAATAVALGQGRLSHSAQPAAAQPDAPAPLRQIESSSRLANSVNRVSPLMPGDDRVQLCQMLSPADPNPIPAVDCVNNCPPGYSATWDAMGPVAGFQE